MTKVIDNNCQILYFLNVRKTKITDITVFHTFERKYVYKQFCPSVYMGYMNNIPTENNHYLDISL